MTASTFYSTEFLVFLLCRQTDKEFRLPWPSFVKIYYRYRLSINRKYILPESWIFHSEVVRASGLYTQGSWVRVPDYTFSLSKIIFFLFPCLSFFSQFRSKTLWEFILKLRQYRICNGKESKRFIFFKIANTPHKAQ